MHGKLRDVSKALEDGFEVVDITSDPQGVDVDLRRNELTVTVHITRDEARQILLQDLETVPPA